MRPFITYIFIWVSGALLLHNVFPEVEPLPYLLLAGQFLAWVATQAERYAAYLAWKRHVAAIERLTNGKDQP